MSRPRLRREDGFSLVWLAMILTLLVGMAGFGIDLGWLYLNTVRAQTAVDAAALAGVVHLPGFDPEPDAIAAARANGFDPGGADNLILTPTDENELRATLSTQVNTFLVSVLGIDHFNVTREATAEYVKPVPLGSPNNCFGGASLNGCDDDDLDTDFWAAVSGRMTKLEDGDPYSTRCDTTEWNGSEYSCVTDNVNYARGSGGYPGYYYAIEVPEGTSNLQVWIYDGQFSRPSVTRDGKWGADVDSGGGSRPDVDTVFTLYRPDISPLIPTDNNSTVCSKADESLSRNSWSLLCGGVETSPTPGIYVLHVESTSNSAGSNNYAVRAETSGGNPRVYGINDMSIWSHELTGASDLYLAEINEDHAGKKLELSFFDAGDAEDESWYFVNDPFGNVPECTWRILDHNGKVLSSQSKPAACGWQTQIPGGNPIPGAGNAGVYNKQWITALIDLPDDPDDMCDGSNCFWTMDLQLANPSERTVWKARVIGNPVRLLP